MSTLEHAIVIAARTHAGQVDKGGAPYILHPLRVMLRLRTEPERIVGVLHDVIEDGDHPLEQLRSEGFSQEIIDAVDSVTRRTGEDYEAFVLRAAADPIGRRVKLADLEDNSDLSRIANPTNEDRRRVDKYRQAIVLINNVHRLPRAEEFPAGTEFVIKEFVVPLSREPGSIDWTNWFGGTPRKYDVRGLRVDNNWPADSYEQWLGVIADSLPKE